MPVRASWICFNFRPEDGGGYIHVCSTCTGRRALWNLYPQPHSTDVNKDHCCRFWTLNTRDRECIGVQLMHQVSALATLWQDRSLISFKDCDLDISGKWVLIEPLWPCTESLEYSVIRHNNFYSKLWQWTREECVETDCNLTQEGRLMQAPAVCRICDAAYDMPMYALGRKILESASPPHSSNRQLPCCPEANHGGVPFCNTSRCTLYLVSGLLAVVIGGMLLAFGVAFVKWAP